MNKKIENLKNIKATSLGFSSCVGVMADEKDFPLNRGNYFSLYSEDGKEYEIANFWYEELVKVLQSNPLTYLLGQVGLWLHSVIAFRLKQLRSK